MMIVRLVLINFFLSSAKMCPIKTICLHFVTLGSPLLFRSVCMLILYDGFELCCTN
jgi:hypothetical protein